MDRARGSTGAPPVLLRSCLSHMDACMGRCRDQVASLGRTESWREINHRLSCIIRMPRSHRRVSRTYAHSPKRECRRASSIHRLRQHVHAQETNGGSEHGGPRQRQSLRSAQITDRIHAFHERARSLCFYYSSALRSYRRARFAGHALHAWADGPHDGTTTASIC